MLNKKRKSLLCLFFTILSLITVLDFCFAEKEEVKGKVMLYTSMKKAQLSALQIGFKKKYPEIEMQYYTAGTGTIMQMLTEEERAGRIKADLLWLGEPSCYYH